MHIMGLNKEANQGNLVGETILLASEQLVHC